MDACDGVAKNYAMAGVDAMVLQCLNLAERNVGRDIKGSTLTYIKR